ncbi:MAG TPA: DUF4962 domain-containing protein [archaeon]|nr:DUF4962 domain-containing protein [archaeon]
MFYALGKTLRLAAVGLLFSVAALFAAEHPSLYFTRNELSALREQASKEKNFQFERLKHWADSHLEKIPSGNIGTSEKLHETCFSTITSYGLLYQLTGERAYLGAGKKWIEALLATPTASEGNYHIGIFAASLAHGYDLFYRGLEPGFRKKLTVKLIQVLEEARYGALHYWWGGIYTHHDFWIPVAGMGLAGLCLAGEYPGADSIVGFAVGELSRAMELLGERGYWPEGAADWVYGMAPAFMFFDALKRAGGPDFYERPWVKATARFRLYHWLPDDTYMYIGDSYRSGRYGELGSVSAHVLMRLASRYRDSHAQWLALRDACIDSGGAPDPALEAPRSYRVSSFRPESEVHGLAWQFLWYDPGVEPVPPDTLPMDMLYPNWDSAIMRAGWGPHDPVLFFAGGHMLGRLGTAAWKAGNSKLPGGLAHTHQNAGSIYLWADGRFPLDPPGYGGRDGRFHSTVMVDGHGQLYEPGHRPGPLAFESGDAWAFASMDLTGAYPEEVGLDSFRRTLVFLKPRTVLMLDRLVTSDGDKNYIRRYEWLLHTDPKEAQWQAGGDSIAAVLDESGQPILAARVFPSTRYFFERQSMDRPDGTPMTRALSVTMIGRLPVEVGIAAVLYVPQEGENTGWLKEAACVRNETATFLCIPATGLPDKGQKSRRAVAFAAADTVSLPPELAECGFVLVTGLEPGQRYRWGKAPERKLLKDGSGDFTASEYGNIILSGIE